MERPLLLGLVEAADYVGVGRSTIRKWACGVMPAPPGFPEFIRLGGRIVLRRVDLEAWVAGLVKPPAPAPALPEKRGPGRPRKVANAAQEGACDAPRSRNRAVGRPIDGQRIGMNQHEPA